MKSVFLLPSARGRRLGQEIVRSLERIALQLGYTEVRLETGSRSPWAIKTYERAGYSRCSRFGEYPDASLSVYMMKRLPPTAARIDLQVRCATAVEAQESSEGEQP